MLVFLHFVAKIMTVVLLYQLSLQGTPNFVCKLFCWQKTTWICWF